MVLSFWIFGLKVESRRVEKKVLEGGIDARERINGLAQDGAEKESEEPMLILLVFRLIK